MVDGIRVRVEKLLADICADGGEERFISKSYDAHDAIVDGVVEIFQKVTSAGAAEWQPLTKERPKIVCLCGSSRFVAEMAVFAWELEKGGAIVMSLHLLPAWYDGLKADHQAEAEGIAEQMDELHKRKIDLADEIFVMNIGGYVGSSTRSEIAYATSHGKPVKYLEPLPPLRPHG